MARSSSAWTLAQKPGSIVAPPDSTTFPHKSGWRSRSHMPTASATSRGNAGASSDPANNASGAASRHGPATLTVVPSGSSYSTSFAGS